MVKMVSKNRGLQTNPNYHCFGVIDFEIGKLSSRIIDFEVDT